MQQNESHVASPTERIPAQSRVPQRDVAKRLLDIAGASIFGIAAIPLIAVAAAALRLNGITPVFFRQTRVGLGNQPFTMLKLRTIRMDESMDVAAKKRAHERFLAELADAATPDPETGLFKPDSTSNSAVGRFLRCYSIDELPQLWNVLRGDMSLVGPRPALPSEVAHFSPAQQRRHSVKPGLTGLWQVNGRSALSTAKMLELDVDYAANRTLWMDLVILARTPGAILKKLTR